LLRTCFRSIADLFHIFDHTLSNSDYNSNKREKSNFGLCDTPEVVEIDLAAQPGVVQSGEGRDWVQQTQMCFVRISNVLQSKIQFTPGSSQGTALNAVGLKYSTALPLYPKGLQDRYAYVVRLAKTVHRSPWSQEAVLARAIQVCL
jgi:hypothetical protein